MRYISVLIRFVPTLRSILIEFSRKRGCSELTSTREFDGWPELALAFVLSRPFSIVARGWNHQ